MSSQNEVNEQGSMVNTQTSVIPQSHKRKPCGVTAMKSVVRARSNNNKLTVEWNAKGQPLNNKGGNKLVSYIGVVVRQNVSIKFKHWSDDRLNVVKDIIWKDINATFDVDEEHKDYIMKSAHKALREFRTNCGKCLRDAEGNVNLKPPAKYANLIDELEQSETPSISAVNLDVLWVDARKNKQVTLKERESFRTADSQYPGCIRGVEFGASKQFLAPSGKRATTADVAVLQDQYDLLTERFQAMESSKFVEGNESTTIGIINNWKLFLDISCTRVVAIGMVYNKKDAMIHNAQIPSNHLKVSIDISIEDDALLPIPVDKDIITIRLALGTFVAWREHLIDVVPIMGKVSADHNATSPPRIDEHASKKAKVVKSKPQSSKSNLESSGEAAPTKTI
ncbi:hypothetical protein Lal_00018686 [Lupinus albus]|nr:hypothetical protein Lal_00018686 [Lupinus albus]